MTTLPQQNSQPYYPSLSLKNEKANTTSSTSTNTNKKTGGTKRLLTYISLITLIILFLVGLIVVVFFVLKYRNKNYYLPSYPIPKSEVYVVLFDEGGYKFLRNSSGTVIKQTENEEKAPIANSKFVNGDSTNISSTSNSTVSFSKYATRVVDVLKSQSFKYAFGDDKGGERVNLATSEQFVNSGIDLKNVKIIANYDKANELADVAGGGTNGDNNTWGDNVKGGSAWIYLSDGFHKISDLTKNSLGEKSTDGPDSNCKVLAVALYGPKQPSTDYNSRQYEFTKTYEDETSNSSYQNGPTNSARPAVTFRIATSDSSGFSSASLIFKFRILPFNSEKWSSVYGNDFRVIANK